MKTMIKKTSVPQILINLSISLSDLCTASRNIKDLTNLSFKLWFLIICILQKICVQPIDLLDYSDKEFRVKVSI